MRYIVCTTMIREGYSANSFIHILYVFVEQRNGDT